MCTAASTHTLCCRQHTLIYSEAIKCTQEFPSSHSCSMHNRNHTSTTAPSTSAPACCSPPLRHHAPATQLRPTTCVSVVGPCCRASPMPRGRSMHRGQANASTRAQCLIVAEGFILRASLVHCSSRYCRPRLLSLGTKAPFTMPDGVDLSS